MKSIFKKIAFVLALAMIVTMLPAKTASAASSDGPQMYSTLRLYIGGDKTGTYSDANYAKVWNKDGYTVAFESDAEEVATVNTKGYVRAVSVGTANITATFTAKDGTTVTKTCVVTVKKNATKAGIGAKDTAALKAGITVGTEMQLVSVRKDENDVVARTGKVDLTDGMRFQSSDESVFTVGATKGKLVAVGVGEATLTVWAVQSEGADPNTDDPFTKYPATTEKKEYTVVVTAAMSVEQTTHNAFQIVFPDEAAAKAAKEATEPSLTNADAAVSENKEVVKVFKVLHDATEDAAAVEQETYIKALSYNKNILTVTMFDEFDEEATYTVKYQDSVESFKTCENVAVELEAYDTLLNITESTVEKGIDFRLYATGKNGQKVDITYSNAYGGENAPWKSSVQLEDTATAYNANYVFNGTSVWFYTLDESFAVKLVATFEDWYVVKGTNANVLPDEIIVTPGNTSVVAGNIADWGIVPYGKDDNYGSKQIAVEDKGYRLAVKVNINEYGADKAATTSANGLDDKFTFISSNNDKLSIDKETGEIYPPKSTVDNVLVHVYYDNTYVGSCPVTVVSKRTFASVQIDTDGTTKLAAYKDWNLESMWYGIKLYDQLGAEFAGDDDGGYILVEVAVADENKARYVEFGTWYASEISGKALTYTVNQNGIVSAMVGDRVVEDITGLSVTSEAPKTAQSVRIVVTATYHSGDGKIEIQRKNSFSVMVKNTREADETKDVKSYTLGQGISVDEHIFKVGDEDNTKIEDKTITLHAFSLDKDGFKIRMLDLVNIEGKDFTSGTDLGNGQATILVKKGSETITTDENNLGFTLSGTKDIVFKAVGTVSGSALTVSGSSIVTISGDIVTRITEGNYIVNLFVGENGKAAYKASTVVSVTNSQDKPQFTWVKYTVEDSDPISIAKQALKLTFDKDRDGNVEDVTSEIVSAEVEIRGNVATIRWVQYNWIYKGVIYEFIIDVNRPVAIAE